MLARSETDHHMEFRDLNTSPSNPPFKPLPLRIEVLGSGTSTGVPTLGCQCPVCRSDHPRNKRLRSSLLITHGITHKNLVIDTTPDFRTQMLRAHVTELDRVLYTHTHADHCHGFDDLRAYSFSPTRGPLPCYISESHHKDLVARFSYAFRRNSNYPGMLPTTDLITITDQIPFQVWPDVEVEPLSCPHGSTESLGFRFGTFAYLTDFHRFPEEKKPLWRGKIHTMIASGVHDQPHPTHSHIANTLELFDDLRVVRGIITHTSHKVDYHVARASLPPSREIAYDGMSFWIDINATPWAAPLAPPLSTSETSPI